MTTDDREIRGPGGSRGPRGKVALVAAVAWGVAVLVGALPAGAGAQDGLALGATPEPPVLETLAGEPVDLAEVVGHRPVLIQFWATWCTICKALEPSIKAAHAAYGDRVEFIVVSAAVAQTKEQVRRHLDRTPMPGRILWDVEGRATRAFDAPGTGYILVLDAAGAVVYTGTGTGQDISAAVARALPRR